MIWEVLSTFLSPLNVLEIIYHSDISGKMAKDQWASGSCWQVSSSSDLLDLIQFKKIVEKELVTYR